MNKRREYSVSDSSAGACRSNSDQDAGLNEPVEVGFDAGWQVAARDQEAEFHVHSEGILGQVGAGQQEPMSVGDGAFHVQDSRLPDLVARTLV